MSDNIKKRAVIALGYFDSVHLGHKKVIAQAVNYAKKIDAITVVFTFKGNLRATLSGGQGSVVYTASEREELIKSIGVDEVFFAPTTRKFLSLGKRAFLNYLNDKYDIVCYVSGEDYRFGKMGKGDVKYLNNYAENNGQSIITVDTLCFEQGKISTTVIKELLFEGKVDRANAILGREYSLSGKVFKDRMVGAKLGFPTINVKPDKEKQTLKFGVYQGSVQFNGLKYKALINYGARPTFGLTEPIVEAHLLDFSGELYGVEVAVCFTRYLREVIKFESQEQLKKQIEEDLKKVKEND